MDVHTSQHFFSRQGYCGLNVGLQNSYVEILTLNVMILGDGAFGKWLGHENGALLSAFIRPFHPVRDKQQGKLSLRLEKCFSVMLWQNIY